MIDELLPFAIQAYQEIGKFSENSFISETSVIDFFPTVQMLQAFQKRMEEDSSYLIFGDEREKYSEWFRYDLGWGAIHSCLLVNVEKLLNAWRVWLKKNNHLRHESFVFSELKETDERITYSGDHFRYIIFCDGAASAQNPYFDKLPFALNKGEGMLVEISGLPAGQVFKKGMNLVPYSENIFWLGSSYEWTFDNDQPSEIFRKNAENWLNYNLKAPFKILEHFAAIRPATLERRPFVGLHPFHPRVGILNGLGTKGCSLAPYFARQLVDKLTGRGKINPLADLSRFARILNRKGSV